MKHTALPHRGFHHASPQLGIDELLGTEGEDADGGHQYETAAEMYREAVASPIW
jgi:hypothetical protein